MNSFLKTGEAIRYMPLTITSMCGVLFIRFSISKLMLNFLLFVHE